MRLVTRWIIDDRRMIVGWINVIGDRRMLATAMSGTRNSVVAASSGCPSRETGVATSVAALIQRRRLTGRSVSSTTGANISLRRTNGLSPRTFRRPRECVSRRGELRGSFQAAGARLCRSSPPGKGAARHSFRRPLLLSQQLLLARSMSPGGFVGLSTGCGRFSLAICIPITWRTASFPSSRRSRLLPSIDRDHFRKESMRCGSPCSHLAHDGTIPGDTGRHQMTQDDT
jgi:hypothetical protein